MKRTVSLILGLLLLCTSSSGCAEQEQDPGPLKVCVDLEKGHVTYHEMAGSAVKGLLETAKDWGGPDPEDVEIELIPGVENGRKAALTNVKNEIMAGNGPDVFIAFSGNDAPLSDEDDPIFTFPEKAMAEGFFLPLDDYLKNAQFLEWDKLPAEIMAAGKNDKGQMLLPLCYTFPAALYPRDQVEPITSEETTWEDMVNDKTGILAAAANGWMKEIEGGWRIGDPWSLFPGAVLGKAEDYESEQLLYTQEELLECAKQAVSLYRREENGEFGPLPEHQSVSIAADQFGYSDYTIVPCYQKNGGVTATVTAFAGINANTKRPEDAFFLLDVLFSGDFQQHSTLYQYFGEANGIPTYEGLVTLSHPASGGFAMTDSTYEEFSRIRSQITAVRFSTVLDSELSNMLFSCYDAEDEKAMEEIVSETYRKLKLYLSES